ncbi:uroporphyrin-III C-methyltransferase [Exophiala xenobiotica]|nr:uroporphyrin-III C-methyltransferase [Exophiala xenobiotica]
MTVPALLTAQSCVDHVHLILGSGPLAASRCFKSIQAGGRPVLVSAETVADLHFNLAPAIEDGKVRHIQREFEEEDLKTLGRVEVDGYVDAVFATLPAKDPQTIRISNLCKRLRIPINVVDAPQLCTFTLLSTYSDGPLQIGITTSGNGCKLASRIRREIVSALPPKFGTAVERLGTVRRRIWEEDYKSQALGTEEGETADVEAEDEEAAAQKHTFNSLVKEDDRDPVVLRTRRMRWLSQICEYWPLSRLAAITDADVAAILQAYKSTAQPPAPGSDMASELMPAALPVARKGIITLAGSGPGHPSLLTIATRTAIENAHLILADKLVPAEILALIPRRTPVHIARKFPGNADAAQEELLQLGLEAMKQGKDVLRLKQGDPYLYGRGAEEFAYFRERGYPVRVIPGITSALSAPLFADIPVTHRAVADQVVICTGTGRKGAAPEPPSYRPSTTVVFLMALHRLESLMKSLTRVSEDADEPPHARRLWPATTPCAVIERASCPDQRVIRSTLQYVCQAVEEEGSRPPGLLVVGSACEVLHSLGEEGRRWSVEEGFRSLDAVGSSSVAELNVLKEMENIDPAPGEVSFAGRTIYSEAVDCSKAINYSNLKGKTIVITGGASGFGKACFTEWAAHGANIIIGDINDEAGTALVAQVRASSGSSEHHFVHLDVTNWQSQAAFFKQAARLSPHGGIDCVMANAGIADAQENAIFEEPPDYSKMDDPPQPRMRTLDTNLDGVMFTTNLALSYLSRNPGSEGCNVRTPSAPRDRHLILVSSIAGLSGLASQPIYATAKHGVVGLFRTLRITTPIKHGIRVNMINPYFVDTPILGSLGSLVLAGGGMATVPDVVAATTRLVADQGIIGRALVIGSKTSQEHANATGLEQVVGDQAVWDVYAHDFDQSDLFTRRIIGVTNLVTQARGWAGIARDVRTKISGTIWKALGY